MCHHLAWLRLSSSVSVFDALFYLLNSLISRLSASSSLPHAAIPSPPAPRTASMRVYPSPATRNVIHSVRRQVVCLPGWLWGNVWGNSR